MSINRHPTRLLTLLLGSLLLVGPAADHAWAQRGGDRGDDRREDRDRGDRDRGDRGRGRDDDDDDRRRGRDDRRGPSDEDRRRWFVSQMDRNGDGKIERSEVDDRWWGRFEETAKAAGFDTSKAIKVDDYLSKRKRQDLQQARDKERNENPTAFLSPVPPEPVPGFDTLLSQEELVLLDPEKAKQYTMPVPVAAEEKKEDEDREERRGGPGWGGWGGRGGGWGGRGDDRGRDERGGGDRGDRDERDERSRGGDEGTDQQKYIKDLMDRYDKDGNSVIEGDEYKAMYKAERSDLNKDGRVTMDELAERIGQTTRSGPGRSGRGGSDRGDASGRRTYRFTSALERMSSEARRWIERYDDNLDGQVSMAEFSSSWTDSKVREFERYDVNGDGIVTGDEYGSRGR